MVRVFLVLQHELHTAAEHLARMYLSIFAGQSTFRTTALVSCGVI